MVRVKRCNALILMTLVGVTFVGKVYGNGGIDYFTGTADQNDGCTEASKTKCCPSLLENQSVVSVDNPGLLAASCCCRCGGEVQSYKDDAQTPHDYCPAGQGYTASARTRFTTLAAGEGGAEGASSSFAPELYHINFIYILSIAIFLIFITL